VDTTQPFFKEDLMRRYASLSIERLEELFSSSHDCSIELETLASELRYRTTRRASALRDRVDVRLSELGITKPRDDNGRTTQPRGRREHPRAGNPIKDKIAPTEEQEECIRLFETTEKLKVNAFAGSGKTTTLRLLAESTDARGIYLAFNRAARNEAKTKFPRHIACMTTHGLAYRALAGRFSPEKMTNTMNALTLAEFMGLRDVRLGPERVLKARSLAYLIKDTIRRFAYSTAESPNEATVPRPPSYLTMRDDAWGVLEKYVRHYACLVWDRMCNASDAIPLGHDGYLKLWALSRPTILADVILLDEAQDTNPVVLQVVEDQAARSKLVFVGDRHQQIYEWRGAVNAMEKIETPDESFLTKSFRFGPAIADAASNILQHLGEHRPIVGNESVPSRVGPAPDASAILCRTNAAAIAELIDALDQGRKPYLVGETDALIRLIQGVQKLKLGEQTDVPELIGFLNWNEVLELVKAGEAEHLRTLVALVESRSEKQMLWALGQTVSEAEANVTISTAHKAKGLEWRSVRLSEDFIKSVSNAVAKDEMIPESEARLFYVALTRARECVDVDQKALSVFRQLTACASRGLGIK
jgi:hypothetical protein